MSFFPLLVSYVLESEPNDNKLGSDCSRNRKGVVSGGWRSIEEHPGEKKDETCEHVSLCRFSRLVSVKSFRLLAMVV